MPPSLSLSFASEHDSLSVRHFMVTERLSATFDISVVALSPIDDIDAESILGQPASFRVAPRVSGAPLASSMAPREWTGICSHFEQIQAEETGLSTYSIRIVPDLWLTTQRTNNRIFQHLTVPQIVEKLLGEWKIAHAFELDAASYPRHEYRVQYGESDFAFLSRLLEEAGISYRFGFATDKGTLVVLSDHPHRGEPRAGGPLPYVDQPSANAHRDFVTRVRVSRELRPGALSLRDFDFRGRLDYPRFGKATPAPGVEAELEQYRYAPGAFINEGRPGAEHAAHADDKEAAALAERSLEAVRSLKRVVSFQTSALDLAPGAVFDVSGHPKAEISPPHHLLVVELRIDGTPSGAWTATGLAVPTDTPYRPQKATPRPRVSGLQSALVVGPKGEEIHTDEYGRVRVQFHWDREGKHDEHSSCWVRVSQGWAGPGFGMMTIPRIGQEVTVGFFEGDPDQPVIIGRVYNALKQVPYKLPEDRTKSGWRTSSSPSSPSSPGFNELMFEDKKGAELVSIRAQRDLHKLVKANEIERTGADRTIAVGKRRTATVGAVDATFVGERHSVVVASAAGQTPTRLEMTDRRIVFTTGEATVTFDGPDLTLEAQGNITIVAHTGDVILRGGPNVKINCD